MMLQLGESYTIEMDVFNIDGEAVPDAEVFCVIKNKANGQYFNGVFFTENETELSMKHDKNGKYSLIFSPNFCSIFEITTKCSEYNLIEVNNVEVYENQNFDSVPIMINQDNFESQNGTDSVICDEKLNPIMGVKINVYKKENGELVAVSQSDSEGHWNLMIPKGEYIFLFEKDGFITASFERTVE